MGRLEQGHRVFAGLDGEMSGRDYREHELVQIGIALSTDNVDEVFCKNIGWQDFKYEPEALAVSGLSVDDVKSSDDATVVDRELSDWLVNSGVEKGSLIPVGWAVTLFDLPFVLKALPLFSSYLHHHAIELNSVCYSLSGAKHYLGNCPSREEWKAMAIKVAEHKLALNGVSPSWHNAGYDALASLCCWDWLRAIIASPQGSFDLIQRGR